MNNHSFDLPIRAIDQLKVVEVYIEMYCMLKSTV